MSSARPRVMRSWFSSGLPIAPASTKRWTAAPRRNITGTATTRASMG